MSTLHAFSAAMDADDAPTTPEAIGALLAPVVEAACAERGLAEADIHAWGPFVTMLFSAQSAWEAVIVGPDAYQFYPGVVRDDTISWMNVWVADNYTRARFVREVEQEVANAGADHA